MTGTGVNTRKCLECGAFLEASAHGSAEVCDLCTANHSSPLRAKTAAHSPGGGASNTATSHESKSRVRVGIAIGVVVLGLLIAVGGAIGIVSMRRAAPDDAFESMVTVKVDSPSWWIHGTTYAARAAYAARADAR